MMFWTAPAKRSDDGAFERAICHRVKGSFRSPEKRCRASLATAVQDTFVVQAVLGVIRVHLCLSVVDSPFPCPRIVAKDVAEEGQMSTQFSPDGFDFFAGDAEQGATADWAGATGQRGAFFDGAGGDLLQ